MPLKSMLPNEFSDGGSAINRGILRRLNPIILLTIFCTLVVFVIIAAMIVFTFLPIFTSTKGNQTKYQIHSEVLTLIYNLPSRLPAISMNGTYMMDDLEENKKYILQNLLQGQLNKNKLTRKTSIVVMEATILFENSSQKNSNESSLEPFDNNHNNTVIILTQPNSSTPNYSTSHVLISLMLRYALECAKKCQNNMKQSIFLHTFHTLEIPMDVFQKLFFETFNTSTNKSLSSSSTFTNLITPIMPCIVNSSSSISTSSMVIAINYEAESPTNTFISAKIQSCVVCSGQKYVDNIGFNNELIFQRIFSEHGGLTIINIYYITDRIRSAEIMVNDLYPSINVKFSLVHHNTNIASLPVALHLCQGYNSIRIYNPDDYTPAFDRLVVY